MLCIALGSPVFRTSALNVNLKKLILNIISGWAHKWNGSKVKAIFMELYTRHNPPRSGKIVNISSSLNFLLVTRGQFIFPLNNIHNFFNSHRLRKINKSISQWLFIFVIQIFCLSGGHCQDPFEVITICIKVKNINTVLCINTKLINWYRKLVIWICNTNINQ